MILKSRYIALLFVISIACDSSTENTVPEDVIESITFETGTVFTYFYSFEETDSTFSEVVEIIEQGTIEMTVLEADRVPGGPEATFKTETNFTNSDEFSETWYYATDNHLLEMAYRNAGLTPIVQPKASEPVIEPQSGFLTSHSRLLQLAGGNKISFDRKKSGNTADKENEISDEVIIRDEPRVVYQFPLEEGSEWISFETPFLQTRFVAQVISGSESESGKKTAVIHVEFPRLDLERWIEIVNTDGLQERILEYTLIATDETGAPRSDVHLRETFRISDN